MKKVLSVALCLLFIGPSSLKARITDKKEKPKSTRTESGYMGLFDANVSTGYMNNTKHEVYNPGPGFEDIKNNRTSLFFHFQESLLSNYFWADQQDKRVKFGFQETLDIGASYGTETTSSTAYTENIKKRGLGFIFAYEAGLAAVYKVNNTIDLGFTYYPFIASTFTPNNRYAKLRLRYSNFMGEFSAFGKTAIELKYLKEIDEGDREINMYYGVSYISNGEENGPWNKKNRFLHFSVGITL